MSKFSQFARGHTTFQTALSENVIPRAEQFYSWTCSSKVFCHPFLFAGRMFPTAISEEASFHSMSMTLQLLRSTFGFYNSKMHCTLKNTKHLEIL